MANNKGKAEGNDSGDNDGTKNDEPLCNRVIAILKEGGDLDSLSLKEHKAYLRNHGLRITGTKAVCQQRILEHWESDQSVCNRIIAIVKEGGDLESLSLKKLKAYLRNHGLRITGTKAVCIQRILEHWSRDETEEEGKEEDIGNNLDNNGGTENDESLCNQVIAMLKEGGDLESMSLKENKAYLRNHGLRITGTKAVCQQRILEHWSGIKNEEEEKEEGNSSDNNDRTENDDSLCNRVITILKEGVDLESLSLKELKAYLRNHGLRIAGTKAVCQQRILEHWSGDETEEEEKEEGNNDRTKNDESLCTRVVTILKEGGDLESLSMKELKAYLRNHGLRITGSKALCQQRILEHWGGNETREEEEDEGNDLNYNDQTENDNSLCNQVIAILNEGGAFESLSLKELKAYLRNLGLLITGTKAVCQQRILEHWRIKDGNAEALYPKSSFLIDCSGDVCKGDVVLFTQKFYKKSDNMTRRHVRLLEKRTIAGRVVKESYGKAKQQHTFTVEVLWSKGTKKFPPLFPLLVKGRNLYKSRTYRQRWCDEAERRNVLSEKHKRGNAARLVKEIERIRVLKGRNLYKSRTYRRRWCDEAERRNVCPGKRKREAERRNVRPEKRKLHTARLVKAIERIRKWSADVGTKHPRDSHQSRPLKNREATETERGKIDMTHTKAFTPRLWYTRNIYQVSSPVGQLKKKQKSRLIAGPAVPICNHCGKRHSGACRRLLGACFRCGSKDHFLISCPGKLSATSVPSKRLSDTPVPSERPTSNTKQYGGIGMGATRVLSVRPIQTTQQDGTSATSVLSERPSATYVPSERPTPTTQDGDFGTKHQKHSHQSRRSKKRKASELEKGKIDKAQGKASIPRDWNTANAYQVSSLVGQVKKKQKSRLRVSSTGGLVGGPSVSKCNHCGKRHSGQCRRMLGACFNCGSKDHFFRFCPGRISETSVLSESLTLTKRGISPGNSGNTGGKQRVAKEEKHVHSTDDIGFIHQSNADRALYSYQPQQNFHHQSASHQFAGNDIGSTSTMVRSLSYRPYMDPRAVPASTKPVQSTDDIGVIHHSNANLVLKSYQPQQNFHHPNAPQQYASNDIGSTSTMVRSLPCRPYMDPRTVPTSTKSVHSTDDLGVHHHSNANPVLNSYQPNFHRQSAHQQLAGNDIGSTSTMVRSLPYRPYMDLRTIPTTKRVHSTHDLGVIRHSNADPVLNYYQPQQKFHHQSVLQQLDGNDIGSSSTMVRSLPYRPYMDPRTIPSSQNHGFNNHNYTHHHNSNPGFCNR
ncbi:uncharacterized protein LOC120125712 [Hibiscus syriacus]|uniref:uncharacterized protein LOC120125712 n=1 Tax=Hibiscus syriacus TaxID=106335 RepID=UPI001921B970|nr:uncharacterized protein LOC120125712 [Hibiscus syriacus]